MTAGSLSDSFRGAWKTLAGRALAGSARLDPTIFALNLFGFAWIFSSEARLFNGLWGFRGAKVSFGPLPPGNAPPEAPAAESHGELAGLDASQSAFS